ncbi:uncharacterized protein Fot_49703 [Forsythia ovata]|uniref:Uncharacterized protein n=1 Tax=Forsythia ovata TaxID=205694 RepID=A0ABD1QCM2_9LAMI
MAEINKPLIQKRNAPPPVLPHALLRHTNDRIVFYFLPIAYVLFYLLFLTKLTSVVNKKVKWILIWDLGIFLFSSMILTFINWVLLKLPNVVSKNCGFAILALPIYVVNAILFETNKNSNQFYQIFAYGGITLMLCAKLSSNSDSLFLLRGLILQFEWHSISYFVDSEADLHIAKGLWMLAVFIVGIWVYVFPRRDAKLGVKFLLALVPQKYCPPIADD